VWSGGSFSPFLVAFSHRQFSQIRCHKPYSIVRNIPCVTSSNPKRRRRCFCTFCALDSRRGVAWANSHHCAVRPMHEFAEA
jgi:hypothetical protein